MKNKLISLCLITAMLFSVSPVFAEDTLQESGTTQITENEDVNVTEDGRTYITINGVEYDITDMTSEEIDALRQSNDTSRDAVTDDSSINDKYKPKYSPEDLIKNGWSSEEAEIKDNTGTGIGGVEQEKPSQYESALRLAVALGMMSKIDGKFAAGELYTPDDFKATMTVLNEHTVYQTNPDEVKDTVTGNDLIVYLSKALGGEILGTSAIVNYRNTVTKSVKADLSKEITREVAAKLIRNAMGAEFAEVSGNNVYTKSGKTFFERMNISGITGLVNANNEVNIFGGDKTAIENVIEINYTQMYVRDSEYNNYLGKYVDAFVENDDDGTKYLISMSENYDKADNIKTIFPGDIDEITNTRITYSPDKKTEKVNVTGSTGIVLNNKYAGILNGTSVNLRECEDLVLYDINDDDVYEWIITEKFEYYISNTVSGNSLVVDGGSTTISFTDKEYINVYIDGVLSKISSIPTGALLAIADDGDPEGAVTIYAVRDSAEGNLAKYVKGDYIQFEGEDEQYPIHHNADFKMNLGEYYQIFFDHKGKVVLVKRFESGGGSTYSGRRYGYFLKSFLDEDDENIGYFKIFEIKGNASGWKTFKGATKVLFENGKSMPDKGLTGQTVPRIRKKSGEIAQHADLQTPQLVVYETDVYDNLTKICTAQNVDNESGNGSGVMDDDVFQLSYKINKRVQFGWQGWVSGKMDWGENSRAVLLVVPTDRSQTDKYRVVISPFGNKSYESAEGGLEFYDVMEDGLIGGPVVRYDEGDTEIRTISSGARARLVVGVENYWDDEKEEEVVKLLLHTNEWGWSSKVDEDIGIPGCITNSDYLAQMPDTVTKIGDLKPGDIIRIDQDTETMEIKAFALDIRIDALLAADLNYFFYSAENGTMITDPAKFTQTGYRYGKIVSIGQSPTTIMVNTHPDPDFKTLLYCPDRNYGIYKWHMKSKTIDNNIKRSSLKPGDIIISQSSGWLAGKSNFILSND